jgi:hypothetical protein
MARTLSRRGRDEEVPDTSRYAPDVDDLDDDDDEAEEETPRRRGSASRHPAGRRTRADESGRRADRRRSSSAPLTQRGWDTSSDKGYSENVKFEDGAEILMKLLEEDPYAQIRQHFIKEAAGRKSFLCIGEGCPLCDVLGNEPRKLALFNVVDLSDPEKPVVKTWQMGKKVANKLAKLGTKQRTSPLNRFDLYFLVERSGTGLETEYSIEAVDSASLEEYYDTTPLTEEELAEFQEKCLGPDSVKYDDLDFLDEIAGQYL